MKQVPDTWAEKKLNPTDNTLDRESVDGVMNEIDEYAIEEALRLMEANGGEVTILSMGPDQAGETIRKALSMGADKGVHVVDDALHGSDALATSAVLAKALERLEWDLVIFGSEATDARMSVVPAMVAERLGAAAAHVRRQGGRRRLHGDRSSGSTDYGYDVVEARSSPAVVSVVEKINEPRYPSFKGIMAAKKKPVDDARPWVTSASTPARSGSPARGARSRSSPPARRGPAGSRSTTRETAASRSPSSSLRRSSSEEHAQHMAEILVLVEHTDGNVKKVTLELLTLARSPR